MGRGGKQSPLPSHNGPFLCLIELCTQLLSFLLLFLYSMRYCCIPWMVVAYQDTVLMSLLLESRLFVGLHPASF